MCDRVGMCSFLVGCIIPLNILSFPYVQCMPSTDGVFCQNSSLLRMWFLFNV